MAETFGRLTKAPTEVGYGANHLSGCKFTSGSAGSLASISLYCKYYVADVHVKCAICDTDLSPLANGTTEEKLLTVGQDGWVTFNFSTPPTVLATTPYWLVFWQDAPNYTYLDVNGEENQWFYVSSPYNGWPDPIAGPNYQDRENSIYATYEEAPPPAAKTLVQAALISIPPLIVLPTLGQILRFAEGY